MSGRAGHRRRHVSGVTDRLNEAMFKKGVTAGKMAKDLGIDYHVIYRAVSGESAISLFVLAKICPYLGVSADWLLGI